jgi:hypothetical protein
MLCSIDMNYIIVSFIIIVDKLSMGFTAEQRADLKRAFDGGLKTTDKTVTPQIQQLSEKWNLSVKSVKVQLERVLISAN